MSIQGKRQAEQKRVAEGQGFLTLRVDRTKMAMGGNVHVYDVLVPADQVDDDGSQSYFIIRDGVKYVSYVDATRSAELRAMPRGLARYEAYKAHANACLRREQFIIESVFPEVIGHDASSFVCLDESLPHATRFVQRPAVLLPNPMQVAESAQVAESQEVK